MAPVSIADHAFWLRVLEEHGIFLYEHLSPREAAWVGQAQQFIDAYAQLRRFVATTTAPVPPEFARDAMEVNRHFLAYKLALMKARINNEVVLNLTPAFMNGVIAELEEYIRLVAPEAAGQEAAPVTPFHHLFLWLPDQIGHAALMSRELDINEREISRQAVQYQTAFTEDYLTSLQMAGFSRAMGMHFPRLELEIEGIATRLREFWKVVRLALERGAKDQLLNRSTAIFLEHHFEETDYFLRKLSESFPLLAQRRPELFQPPR